MINQTLKTTIALLTSLLIFSACGNGETEDPANTASETEEQSLTEFELEHGIGPITERLDISDDIDEDLRLRGQNIFEMKCEMCHNMEGRMVGPELGNVLDRRSPEFIMNMILNPGEMANDHPVGQELLREHMTVMPFQNVEKDDARAIVEYLRDYSLNN